MILVEYRVEWRETATDPWRGQLHTSSDRSETEGDCAVARNRFPKCEFRIVCRTVIYHEWVPL